MVKRLKNKIKTILLICILFIFLAYTIFLYISKNIKENYIYNENLFNISRTSRRNITQGDIVIYEFRDKMFIILDDIIEVKILNPNDTVVGKATVKNNKIIVDTSPLSGGAYRLKILYNSQEMILKDDFFVVLIAC